MSRHPPRVVALAVLAVAAFGVVTLATSGVWPGPQLLYDGPSYVALAQHIREHWFLPPPSLNLRPHLYPAVIAVAGWLTGSDGLAAVVKLQILGWLLVGPLITLWVYRVGGGLLIAGLAGSLYYTLTETFLNIWLVYAETITVTLAVASGLALTSAMAGGPRATGWRWAAAALALASAHARPLHQLLLPLDGALASASGSSKPRALVRRVTPFVVAAIVGLGPFYVASAILKGSPTFVSLAGHCLVDYLGDRRLLGKFPTGYAAVAALYASRFAADPTKQRIGWWDVNDDWERVVQARTGRKPGWAELDREMMATAVAVLARNPGYYVRRWGETWWEFSTTADPAVTARWCPITLAVPVWTRAWAHLGAFGPFAILALEIVHVVRRGRGAIIRLVPIVTYLALALVNTAIEPWPGQLRYRTQVDAFLIVALGLVAALGWDAARAAVTRWRA